MVFTKSKFIVPIFTALVFILNNRPLQADEAPAENGGEKVEHAYPSSPPISIDDAETVEKNHFEINLTAGFSGGKSAWETESPLIDANYGLTDNIHVNGEIPYVLGYEADEHTNGLGRPSLAVKFRVLNTENLAIAFHPAIEFPPIPSGSIEKQGDFSYTIPVVFDLGLGHTGAGIGIQASSTLSQDGKPDSWGGIIGIAAPLAWGGDIMLDFAEEADSDFEIGEGLFELGYARDQVFGIEYLNLLSNVGMSTEGNFSCMLGGQIAL